MKDYVEASDPVEQAPIKIPNSRRILSRVPTAVWRSLEMRITMVIRKKNVPQVPHMSGWLCQKTYKCGNLSHMPNCIRGPIPIAS